MGKKFIIGSSSSERRIERLHPTHNGERGRVKVRQGEQAHRRRRRIPLVMTGDLHRRQFVRVEVSLPVEFALEGEPVAHDGSVFDLGAGGMRLVASYDLPPRANLNLKFRLPAADRGIVARGRVVLSFFQRSEQKFHHGIAFTSLDPKDRSVISEFVEHQDARRSG